MLPKDMHVISFKTVDDPFYLLQNFSNETLFGKACLEMIRKYNISVFDSSVRCLLLSCVKTDDTGSE